MIEFSGEFSEKSKKYMLKKNAIVGLFASLSASIIFSAILIIIAAIYDLWIITLFMIVLVLTIILATASPYIQKKKTLNLIIPKKISIDGEYIYYDLEKASISKPLTSINKVIDYGDSYLLKLHFPKVDGFLCQKDLISKGTIKEFEKLFEDKIIKK